MRLCVLGPVEVAAEGRQVGLDSERQRTILAVLLAARGEIVSTDRLVDGLWGPQPPASSRKTLQSYVSRLRRALESCEPAGGGVLVTSVDGYWVNLSVCELDAARFEELIAQARDVLVSDSAAAVGLLDDALALWRGAAFGELAAHELVRAEALRLEQLRDAAAADRIDARISLGRHDEVIGELEAAVADDPLGERAHAQLMLVLYRSGHQAEALATYRGLRQRLGDEVGIDPSPELRRLHEQILHQDEDLAAPDLRPAPYPHPVPGQSHPREAAPPAPAARTDDLFGRDEDIGALAELVRTTPLVTLIGAGGVGKTRLAEHVAAATTGRLGIGAATCSLAAVRDADSAAVALIDALGARDQGGRPPEETVVAALGTRRLLLVIDNCEHLLGVVAQLVESILAKCPGVSVLATSREPLRLPGERVWQVAPLATPRVGAGAAEVADAPAGVLFVARAREAQPAFALTDDNAHAVGALCRRLDGMPLAIELAAVRVRAMTVADLLERIDQRFSLLTGGPRREQGRHQTLQTVVSWSYELLSDREARLFDRLSVFAGPFPLAAAERVCAGEPIAAEHVAGVLAELVDKSMVAVDRTDDGARYRLLDTLRGYGSARLTETCDAERYQRAHAAYHLTFAEALGPRVRGADERTALAAIDAAVDDLRVAHAWLVSQRDVDAALRLPVALRDYIGHRQRDEMVTWTERALDLPGAEGHGAYPAALATVARGATRRGELDRARAYAEAALARAEPTSLAATWAMHALATAALYEGRLDDALALASQRPELDDVPDETYYRAVTHMIRVLSHLYRGEAQTAAAESGELRALAESSGNLAMQAWALYCHGEALLEADPAAASPLLEQAIEAARAVDSRIPEGAAMVSLASLCGRQGDTDRAAELFGDVIAHWRRLGDWTHQLTTLRNLVEFLVRFRADEAAATLHGAVIDASPPSFGAEAERLASAWTRIEQRLGSSRAHTAAERGRRLSGAQAIDEALAALHRLRAG